MGKLKSHLLFLLLLPLSSMVASSDELDWGGEFKLQQFYARTSSLNYLADLSAQEYGLTQSSFRLKSDWLDEAWSVDFDYLLSIESSNDLAALRSTKFSQTQTRPWLDLQSTISQNDYRVIAHTLDRASVAYTSDNWVFKIGRQALTWSNGIVFHPFDLFSPFSPDATDTSYKPGVDMVYYQQLLSNGGDLQFLWVPRRDQFDQREDSKNDSVALKRLFYLDSLQVDLLLAKDYNLKTYGVGLAAPVGEALWKMDLSASERELGSYAWSLDLNFQYSWQWQDKSVSGFVEYYLNGFGDKNLSNLSELSFDTTRRLQRGQLFSFARDQIAVGLQIQWSALLMVSPILIAELDNASQYTLLNFSYSASQSTNWIFGLQLASGDKGSQYGGVYLDPEQNRIFQPPDQAYFRFEFYY